MTSTHGSAKVKPEALRERIAGVTSQLEDLARNAEATRNQLAHITLGASELEINVATEQVGAMKWQVTEMQRIDALLDG
jgi:anti-sigma regulatory factor (Ser/Thr protein kinase)